MKKGLKMLVAAGSLVAFAPAVLADHEYDDGYFNDDRRYDGYEYDDDEYEAGYTPAVSSRASPGHEAVHYARVVDVEPIYRTVAVRRPVRDCWDERVVHYDDRSRRRSAAPATVAGGVIGGVIGRQFGDGRGRDAMTVLGTLIGSAVANDNATRRNDYRRGYGQRHVRTVERCETTSRVEHRERIDGYTVTYLYNDRYYTTRTDTDPGERIAVRVNVTPVGRY